MRSILALLSAGTFGFAYFGKLIDAYDHGLTGDDVKQAALYAVLCTGAVLGFTGIIAAVVMAFLSGTGGAGE